MGKRRLPFWLGLLIGITSTLIAVTLAVLIVGVNALSFLQKKPAAPTYTESDASFDENKIETILAYIDAFYLFDYDKDAVTDSLANGLIKGLGDKYAEYFTVEEYAKLREDTAGEYAGIGVVIQQADDGSIEVVQVYEGSPAEAAGIQAGDIIVEAEGVRNFKDIDALIAIVRGEPGTPVNIVVERKGKEIPKTVKRERIETKSVAYKMLDGKIGYIYISQFDTITVSQFEKALDDLEAQGAAALIFDLRNNPGGDYDAVMAMSDRVLPEGTIMTVEDNHGVIQTETSDEEHKVTLPLVVIVNGNTASAAEVFSGAIQDYKMATIVGTQTYGKGIVQSVFSLPDGSGIKFTTLKYFTPSGDSVDGVGVTPDIVVEIPKEALEDGIVSEDEDTQLHKALELLEPYAVIEEETETEEETE